MAFPQLGGAGADCGPANPMANLMKQFQQDRSLQQDRMREQRGESSSAGFRSQQNRAAPVDHQFADEFLRGDVAGPSHRPPNAFEFGGLSRELKAIQGPPPQSADWAADFMQQQHIAHPPPDAQFEEFESIYQQNMRQGPTHQWHEEFEAFRQAIPEQIQMSKGELEAFEKAYEEAKQGSQASWEKEFAAQEPASWAEEFAEQENGGTTVEHNEALSRTAGMLLQSVDADNNPKFQNSKFMDLMRKLRDREVTIKENKMVETKGGATVGGDWAAEFGQGYETPPAGNKSWADDFAQHAGTASSGNMWSSEFAQSSERGWAEDFTHIHGGVSSSRPVGMANQSESVDWASEFNKIDPNLNVSAADMEKAFGKGSEMEDWVQQYHRNIAHLKTAQDAEWDEMQKDWERVQADEGTGYRAANPEYDNYHFMANNPYLINPQAIDSVQHTTLADSIMALEAKTQLEGSNANAWVQLGFRQQENERDAAAIAALKRAVSMDPSLLDGWLALAVSYTNENCRAEAYDALEHWIANNEKYRHLANGKGRMAADRHAHITNMFLEAARSSPGAEMDADVQIGLGVLFNVSEEYAKAIDCFKSALHSRPQDYLLWNKLGATLANSRDTAGAIEAYFNALEINPSYVRARYNLAISCINLGQNREAAEHLLTALALQQGTESAPGASVMTDSNGNRMTVPSGMSDNVWDSLRMLMYMMNREDLAAHCDQRNLNAFRGEFDF